MLRIVPEALQILKRCHWVGNIRKLENVIQRAVIMSDGSIDIKDLPDILKFEIDFPEADFPSLKEMEKAYIKRVLLHARK